jgi:sialic acid synthase SpsE
VSAYPAALGDTNLGFIQTLKRAFGTAVGFSDHTLGREAACAAVALGATWIEKHFTVDRSLEGFDHKHALEPADLAEYIAAVRDIEASMAPRIQKIGPAEAYTRKRARRGIYAARDLPAGHVITEDDLLILRPEGPIPADSADDLIGARLKQALSARSVFTLAGLEYPAKSSA